MNNVAQIEAKNYGIGAREIAVVSAMQMYLCEMEDDEALAKIAQIYTPKVLRIESSELVPVRSHIDGAKYTSFIDEAVANVIQRVRGQRDGMADKVLERLKEIDGKHMVERASVEFMGFVEDAYMLLKKD